MCIGDRIRVRLSVEQRPRAPVALEDLPLHDFELRRQHLQAQACIFRDAIVASIGDRLEQAGDAEPAGRCHHAELRDMGADRVRVLRALPVQHEPDRVQHHKALPLRALHRSESHCLSCHRFADRLGIGSVVHPAHHLRLHVLRRHQLYVVAECSQLTRQ